MGFQYPKKWVIWKQWPILEKNCIAAVTYWGKLTSYMSQESRSAKKNSQSVTVAELEDQTCHPPNPHFGWRPFSQVGFVQKVMVVFAGAVFLISSRYSFRLEAIFISWICSESDGCICGGRFSNFLPILISAGGHFHKLDLFRK